MKFFNFSKSGSTTGLSDNPATPRTKSVTKVQLLNKVAQEVGVPKADVERILVTYLEAITSALGQGNSVVISGFGKFKPRKPRAGNCRNPITGKAVRAPNRKSVTFRASQGLKNKLKTQKES